MKTQFVCLLSAVIICTAYSKEPAQKRNSANATPETSALPEARRVNWKAAEIEQLITASSKPEIRAKFGPPDKTFDRGTWFEWNYTKMKILDSDTEKTMTRLKIWFHPDSDTVRRIVISD